MQIKTRTLVQVALLLTLEILLSRFFSISTPFVKIGFAFVPVVICAMAYGPVWAGIMAALGDLIGAMLFPIGVYFPGFTLSSALCGIVYGLFLHKQNCSWPRLCIMLFIVRVVINLGLSTYWLTVLTGLPFSVLASTRILQTVILIPLQLIIIRALESKLRKQITVFS